MLKYWKRTATISALLLTSACTTTIINEVQASDAGATLADAGPDVLPAIDAGDEADAQSEAAIQQTPHYDSYCMGSDGVRHYCDPNNEFGRGFATLWMLDDAGTVYENCPELDGGGYYADGSADDAGDADTHDAPDGEIFIAYRHACEPGYACRWGYNDGGPGSARAGDGWCVVNDD